MKTNKEQNRVNTYFQDVTIKNACELLSIEKCLQLDGLVLPNNVIVNRNGISCVEFIQWYEKSQYPKTYEECCAVLDCRADYFFTDFSHEGCDIEISDYEYKIDDLLKNFRNLRYCRDAYWKIAGKQMGLGKPWEPDWKNESDKYFICYLKDELWMSNIRDCNRFLVFPTKEIRDTFYENFKDLIERCKELL